MRRRAVRLLIGLALVGGVAGVLPSDDAGAHSCTRLDTPVTTLGDPGCQPHDPLTHDCRETNLAVGMLFTCVEGS
ncbi:MAG: hypothetical protein M3394_00830 [Actinomycetota bacterium]|nr:hypothetical protein [Actinomycetota bacterium]